MGRVRLVCHALDLSPNNVYNARMAITMTVAHSPACHATPVASHATQMQHARSAHQVISESANSQ
jgi:hypothetical protein